MPNIRTKVIAVFSGLTAMAMMFQLSAVAMLVEKPMPNTSCPSIACRDGGICASYAGGGCGSCGYINSGGVGTCHPG